MSKRLIAGRRLAWGGIALFAIVAIYGLPIGSELSESSQQLAVEKHAALSEHLTSAEEERAILPIVLWGSLYFIAALLVMKKRLRASIDALRSQWPLSLLLILTISSALWSPHTEKVVTSFVHALGMVFVALAAAFRYQSDPPVFSRHLGYALSCNLCIHLTGVWLIPGLTVDYTERWMGFSGNANTLGSIAFCAIWANWAAILLDRGGKVFFHWIGLLVGIVALLGSASITSTLVTAVSVMLTTLFVYGRRWWGLILAFLFLVILLLAAILVLDFGGAMDPMIDWFTEILGRSSDLSGRTLLWFQAIELISQSPWIGWGFDDNTRVILETGMPHTTYHNGYLDLGVRGGGLAILLLFAMLAVYFRSVLKRMNRQTFQLSLPFVASVLIFNIAEVSLAAARNLIWMIFLVLILISLPMFRPSWRESPQHCES